MNLGRLAAGAATVAAFAWLLAARTTERGAPRMAEAEQLYRAALDRELALDLIGAAALLRRSLERDPAYLPALFELATTVGESGPGDVPRFLDSAAAITSDGGLAICLRMLSAIRRGVQASDAGWTASSNNARLCRRYAFELGARSGTSRSESDDSTALREELGWTPAVAQLSAMDPPALDAPPRHSGGTAYRNEHPLTAAHLLSLKLYALHRAGRDADAVALERAIKSDPRWAYPGFRLLYYHEMMGHESLLRPSGTALDSQNVHALQMIAESLRERHRLIESGDPYIRARERVEIGTWMLDRGRLEEAHAPLAEGARISDSLAQPTLQAWAHMRLGRALVKMGQTQPAERELLLSRNLARAAGSVVYEKEAEHNLLHLYDAAHEDAKAHRAGLAFVRLATLGGLSTVGMMSQHDMGMFLRSRGDLEAARPYFARMLADIDSLRVEYGFAAEYYELVGNLDRAEHYYSLGVVADQAPIRALAGLVRVARAKGKDADAVRYARLHDEQLAGMAIPESEALLPGILLAIGKREEGRAALDKSRAFAGRRGQVAAWASLTLATAEFELSAGKYGKARTLADSARGAAARVAAHEIILRATTTAALASIREGVDVPAAHAQMGRALTDAERLGNPQLRAELHRLRGEALSTDGSWRAGLAHYRTAAAMLDRIASGIALDPDRAGYRSAQRRVYDDALATIVAHRTEPDAVALFIEWSARRKTRGFNAGRTPSNGVAMRNPSRGRAIIDYVVLDTAVAAVVITAEASEVLLLPVRADSLRAAISAFRTAMDARLGSRLDLSRAAFPLARSHKLYQLLLEPMARLLPPHAELTIVPDGPLHLVPFDALVIELGPSGRRDAYRDATYVLDRYSVREAMSAGTGAVQPTARRGVLVVAPGSAGLDATGEVAAVRRRFGESRVAVLEGTAAVESGIRERAETAGVLHFAAHASINALAPSSSALHLVADTTDDGDLHAFEIAKLSLAGSLVVLSACETAAGPVFEGEGVLSLSRSFFQAGAQETVATLWPVGPQAARFMARFYASLTDATDAAAAVHAAKMELRRAGESPVFWAPFISIRR